MIDSGDLLVFISASLALLIVPGPAVLYIVARSIDYGRLAGIISVLGIATGSLVHVTAAAVGLSAILVSSAFLFNVVKYLGAAYLIYLGIRALLSKSPLDVDVQVEAMPYRKIYTQGVIVNVLNPKTALFFFAFLPQFIDPQIGAVPLQVIFLGSLFTGLAILSDGMYALIAGTVREWLRKNQTFIKAQKYFSGVTYIFLGVLTATSGSKSE